MSYSYRSIAYGASAWQAELEELKPTLKKTAEDTAQLMVVIEGKQKEAAATEQVVSKERISSYFDLFR